MHNGLCAVQLALYFTNICQTRSKSPCGSTTVFEFKSPYSRMIEVNGAEL
jgi:hypothetical protein